MWWVIRNNCTGEKKMKFKDILIFITALPIMIMSSILSFFLNYSKNRFERLSSDDQSKERIKYAWLKEEGVENK